MTRLMTIGVDGSGLRCLAQGFLSHYHWKDDNTLYIYGRANSGIDSLRNSRLLSCPILVKPLQVIKRIAYGVLGQGRVSSVGKSFILVTDTINPIITPFAQELITVDGHPMTNPIDSNWCVNDTYPDEDGIRELMLYNFEKNLRIDLGSFKRIMGPVDLSLKNEYFKNVDENIIKKSGEERFALSRTGYNSDLHPRWTADGTKAVFDSIHEGTRQIYYVDVKELMTKYR